MESARQIEIPINRFKPSDIGLEEPLGYPQEKEQQIADYLTANAEIMALLRSNNIRCGDIVHVEAMGEYRNDGKFIFDGESIIPLDYSRDEYGAVPPQFKVIDDMTNERGFPTRYWVDVIIHNGIVHFDPSPYVEDIMKNLQVHQIDETGAFYKSSFTHANGETYTIYWTYQDPQEFPITREKIKWDLCGGVFSVFDEVGFDEEIGDYDPDHTLFVSIFSQGHSIKG